MKTLRTIFIEGLIDDIKPFSHRIKFILYPPKSHVFYGTGMYMSVEIDGTLHEYVDVRYAMSTDINELSANWLHTHYGYCEYVYYDVI